METTGGVGTSENSSTLLVIVVDISLYAWGDHEMKRQQSDTERMKQNKRSVGPAILNELLSSVLAYIVTLTTVEKNSYIIVIGAADNESSILFPRQNAMNEWLQQSMNSNISFTPNISTIQNDLISGVAELIDRASKKVLVADLNSSNNHIPTTGFVEEAAMAAAFSKAICIINRFLVAAQSGYGISALSNTNTSRYSMEQNRDSGVIALTTKDNKKKTSKSSSSLTQSNNGWSPRIFIIQASQDRSRDYNAFMNCAFASAKHHIVVDGCYLSSELNTAGSNTNTSSSFLEQTCDITGGVYLAPSGAAQVGGALTAVLCAVFLAPLSCRHQLHLPTLSKIDYRAKCFQTNETIDIAYVCNQCLSIYKDKPKSLECPTCHATIIGI